MSSLYIKKLFSHPKLFFQFLKQNCQNIFYSISLRIRENYDRGEMRLLVCTKDPSFTEVSVGRIARHPSTSVDQSMCNYLAQQHVPVFQ